MEWIRSQRFDSEIQRQVLEDYYREVVRLEVRVTLEGLEGFPHCTTPR